ncbi:MAG: gluconate 2-dehydrogenase subunit 3 family protein [Flavobacteriaceae bacterium]
MDRRKALKNMGLAMGYTVATPTLISLMQSCKSENILEWTPEFFTKDEGSVLGHLVDIIIPKTDTPSATELQVNVFIDKFAKEVMEKEQQSFVKMSMTHFIEKALKDSGKEKASDLTPEDLESILTAVLKISKAEHLINSEAVQEYQEAIEEGKEALLSERMACFAFANNVRDMTIWGYKSSEYVGEKVLAYLPVPGEYIPCGNLEELTQGKAWSL